MGTGVGGLEALRKIITTRWSWVVLATVGLATPRAVLAEPVGDRAAAAWTFFEAWRTFRYDLDTTLPGEHGEVPLVERIRGEPPWVLRDGLRVATSPGALTFLARRSFRRDDTSARSALWQAVERTTDEAARQSLERALLRLGDARVLRRLVRRLRSGRSDERWRAATALRAAGPQAVGPLTKALDSPNVITRLAAASALAAQDHRGARQLLGKQLKSSNPFHRVEAAHALALANDGRGLPVLRSRIERPGADLRRLVSSLGRVGSGPDKRLLIGIWSSLPRGRSLELRRDLRIALGRITLRTKLEDLRPAFERIDGEPDDLSGSRGAWLEALGWAVARGANDKATVVSGVRQSIDSPMTKETPVAFQWRARRVRSLLAVLEGEPIVEEATGAEPPLSEDVLIRRLRARNVDDARIRAQRFDAAVTLLARVGARLDHGRRADPPREAHPTGLGAERALDGSYLTAWIAGEMAGPLRLELPEPQTLTAIEVINGCVDSRRSYRGHARIRALRITLDGERVVEGRLDDGDPYFQRIALPRGHAVRQLALEVIETYAGEREDAAACLAELRLE